MDKILRVIQRFPVILATILLFLSTGVCWYVFLEKNSTNIYYLSTIIYLISSFLLVIGSFKYRLFKIRSTVLLLGASLLLVVALFDFYLLTFCFDTSGPGGQNVITHRHWYNKFVSNNEYGFWERSLARFKNPVERHDQLVIAAVGDSFTWGQGLKGNAFRLTERLEKKLNSDPGRKKISLLNFGKGGADTLQEKEIIEDFVPKVHPDIVLLCYISNDILPTCDAFNYDKTWDRLSTITPTVNFFYWRLIGQNKSIDAGMTYMNCLVNSYNDPEKFKKHVDDLQALFKEVQNMGAKPVFVLMPFPHMWKLFPKQTKDDVYGRLKRAVSDAGVPIIDLSYIEKKYTPDDFQVNPFDGHPNAKMHEEFAETIYRWLENNAEFANLLKKQ